MSNVSNTIKSSGWKIIETLSTEGKGAENFSINALPVSDSSKKLLRVLTPSGIYRHQKEAIQAFLNGQNVCLATGTASGKSLAFQISAIEQFAKDPTAKVIAIYPMKALGREQAERWETVLKKANIPNAEVGVIDGSVSRNYRAEILRRS